MDTANEYVNRCVREHGSTIQGWLAGSDEWLVIETSATADVGTVYSHVDERFVEARAVRTLLRRKPGGWFVRSAFPISAQAQRAPDRPGYEATFADLRYLAASYFSQDYIADHGSDEGAIEAFNRESVPRRLATLRAIDVALGSPLSDDGLACLWHDTCSSQYLPLARGLTYRWWFILLHCLIGEAVTEEVGSLPADLRHFGLTCDPVSRRGS